MAIQKLTGNRAQLGGIAGNIQLNNANLNWTTSSYIYGTLRVQDASSSVGQTRGGIQLGGMGLYIKKIALTADWLNGGTTSQRDTGWDLPRFSIVEDVWMQTITAAASATNTMNVGLQGAAQTFLTAVTPVSSFTPGVETYRGGGNGGLVAETTTFWYRVPYPVNTATSLSVIVTRSATVFSATWVGNLYIKYYKPTT
jgi:hypothetical protein